VSRKIQVCVGLFAIALVVFRASPRGQLYDSRYTLLVAHRIVADGALALDPFVEALGGVDGSGRPHDYRLVRTGQQVHWFYPPGTPLLAAPFVALADAAGAGPVDPSGRYDRDAERRMQRWLAAAAMAAAGVLLFLTARQRLPERPSLAVAGAALFATPIWSTASRSLWSQTFALLLLSGAVLLLVRGGSARRGGGDTEDAADGAGDDAPLHPVLLGTLLAWAWLCRPTAALAAVGVVAWAAVARRDALLPLAATGALWGALFLAFFQGAYGSVLPPYYSPASHAFGPMPVALAGNWISPARGLLVYSPVVLVPAVWVLARWRRLPDRPLAALAGGVIAAHWLLVSSHAPWWGGYGYGPRLMAETVPWIVVGATLGWAAWRADPPPEGARRNLARGVAVALLAWSVLLHGIGAVSRAAADWNHRQSRPDFPAQLWHLDDAPFLAPWNDGRAS